MKNYYWAENWAEMNLDESEVALGYNRTETIYIEHHLNTRLYGQQ